MIFPRKPPADFVYDPPMERLNIIFEDEGILIVDKPSGLLSVPGRKEEHKDSLQTRVLAEYPTARIVHRLDMDTSGLMIMALNADIHRNLNLQFEQRKTEKQYIARVWGVIEQDHGEVDLPLICDWPNRPLQMINLTHGKQAKTGWQVSARDTAQNVTRVNLFPITGRTHQLRVHMAEIGHPILGDDFYAHEKAFRAEDRLHLHAHRLMVTHPVSAKKTWFESPCPF